MNYFQMSFLKDISKSVKNIFTSDDKKGSKPTVITRYDLLNSSNVQNRRSFSMERHKNQRHRRDTISTEKTMLSSRHTA
ncbi:uncharacterized protein NDAI_0B05820 [Naumovozyma dairenensis CBS 421]|uniref:Uncharacterized protein n=1 Tax=Naumovozyma dairenensis (strain ATCC 10597 / BCRC 20456 / CBS 421 / NBRC 0211 / NRRL Y-12639) TaxID=1071378 RepID=G0W754_NAUDC|nr:hypothetical protein NDAI_0B05820 [Naumovozyma dairenensis CBS 421]CCD23615.1 hypothetical protein NDAI_0B05820 [Naumovozyma dairenensis CBS 421]